MQDKIIQIFFGCKTEEEIKIISQQLLKKRLIACIDTFPINSNYFWNNSITKETRFQAIAYSLKTKQRDIEELIRISHPDVIPAIVFSNVTVNKEYSDWIISELNK